MGFTSVMPFIPLYVLELGVEDAGRATAWAGFANGAAGVTMALTAPLWGRLSDRVGRKLMLLRATMAASVVIGLIGFVSEPWQLLLLRLLQGTLTGTVPAATALVASDSPPATVGRRLGMLQTMVFVAGAAGPVFGGMFADYAGLRSSFFLTSGLLRASSIVALVGVPEVHRGREMPEAREEPTDEAGSETSRIPYLVMLPGFVGLFLAHGTITSAVVSLPGFLSTLEGTGGRLASLSGQIVGTSALTAAIGSAFAGRFAGKIGARPVLLWCTLFAGLTAIPHAWVTGVVGLWALRLVNSAFLGGIIPASNLAVKEVPRSRHFSQSASGVMFRCFWREPYSLRARGP